MKPYLRSFLLLLCLFPVGVLPDHPAALSQPQSRAEKPFLSKGWKREKPGSGMFPTGLPSPQAKSLQLIKGEDPFHYWLEDGASYAWIDASAGTDTGLSGNCPGVGPISMPFPFKFYGNLFSNIYISCNGYLTFNPQSVGVPQAQIPSTAAPNNVIAPYWAPTTIGTGGWIRYLSGGIAPNRYFVVEWNSILDGSNIFHYEAILYETGEIIFQYNSMFYSGARSCQTVGIENSTGTDGLYYYGSCASTPSSLQAIRLHAPKNFSTNFNWKISTVEAPLEASMVWNTSMAIDHNDRPHFAYAVQQGYSTWELRYARWNGSEWIIEKVDDIVDSHVYTSIKVDGNNHPAISYFSGGQLKYAAWDENAWVISSLGAYGRYDSLALDKNGDPHISYCSAEGLSYAALTGTVWSFQSLSSPCDLSSDGGAETSLALDTDGHPQIAYYYHPSGFLKYAEWDGGQWLFSDVAPGGLFASLVLDDQDQPHIASERLQATLQYSTRSAGAWTTSDVFGTPKYLMADSIALDSHGRPRIAFGVLGNAADYLVLASMEGSTWKIDLVESGINLTGQAYISLGIDSKDKLQIGYGDFFTMAVKYASGAENLTVYIPLVKK
jgi:hypothetical protein